MRLPNPGASVPDPDAAPGVDRLTLATGDELELGPGEDARLVHAAVVDDTKTDGSGSHGGAT